MLIQNIGSTYPAGNYSNAGVAVSNATESKPVASSAGDIAKAAGTSSPQSPSQAGANRDQLQQAVDSINGSLQKINADLKFSVDRDSSRVIVKVVESKSGDIIKQFPSEETLSIAKAIDHFQRGLLLEQKA